VVGPTKVVYEVSPLLGIPKDCVTPEITCIVIISVTDRCSAVCAAGLQCAGTVAPSMTVSGISIGTPYAFTETDVLFDVATVDIGLTGGEVTEGAVKFSCVAVWL
jgi:hypothetical protein